MRLRHGAATLLTFALLGGSSVDAGWLDGLGTSQQGADREVAYPTEATCNLKTVRALSTRHPNVRQFIVLVTEAFTDTHGQAYVAVRRSAGDWACQTSTTDARFGRSGTRRLVERRSGDGTTPAGVFPMGAITAWDGQRLNVFGNSPDPGVKSKVAYRDVEPEDCWGAIPNDADYNHLVNKPECAGPDNEWLQRFGGVYSHAAIIGANLDPTTGDTSGDEAGETPFAAAIFLHRHSYGNGRTSGTSRPTSGCVSLPTADLVATITALDPDLDPHYAIGPLDYLVAEA